MHDRPQRRLAASLVATAIATAACAGSDRTAPAPPPTAEAASTSTLASATTEVRTTAGLPEPTAATEIDWQGIAADSAEAFVREMGDGGPSSASGGMGKLTAPPPGCNLTARRCRPMAPGASGA